MRLVIRSITYNSWRAMKERCLNPKSINYCNYGGRGITVSNEWMKFDNFLNDMGHRPTKEYSIDRIDNSLGYCKDNCIWASRLTQANNKRTNRVVNWAGHSATVAEWSRLMGIPYKTLLSRLVKGDSAEIALTTPPNKRFLTYTFLGKATSLKTIAKLVGINYSTLHTRIKVQGLTLSEAIKNNE